MKRIELLIEHYHKSRFLKSRRFRGDSSKILLGSSHAADIRLMGDDVNGLHAMIEYTPDQGWILYDLASPTGTRVEGEPICEKDLKKDTVISIGHHELKILPKEIEATLFVAGEKNKTPLQSVPKGNLCHQIVIRRNDQVIETHLLGAQESFRFPDGDRFTELPPPPSAQWVEHQFGTTTVQQRLIPEVQVEFAVEKRTLSKNDKLAGAVSGALSLVLIVAVMISGWLGGKQEPEKFEENRYSKMIYDAKITKQKKESSVTITKKIETTAKAQAPKSNSQPSKKTAKAAGSSSLKPATSDSPKLITNIKAAGLGKLVGRIRSRADSSLSVAAAIGPNESTSDMRGSGRGIASTASVGQLGNGDSKGSRYKLAAVGTSGRGGGLSDFKGIGGLKSGNVGAAEVGFIEEETEVQGGLDREVIAQYIKSQLGQIRYCYERQLSATPDLYGKVQVKFVIGGNGQVATQSIGTSTLKSAMVEGCILRRVAGWKFPAPEGGTQVRVTYPFLFKSTN